MVHMVVGDDGDDATDDGDAIECDDNIMTMTIPMMENDERLYEDDDDDGDDDDDDEQFT